MCKEDIRIGRKKSLRRHVSIAPAIDTNVFGANANRAVVLVSVVPDDTIVGPQCTMLIRAGTNNSSPVLAVINQHNPNAVMTIEEYGQIICEPIRIDVYSNTGVSGLHVSEIEFLEPLDEV